MYSFTIDDVAQAAGRSRDYVRQTPLLRAHRLEELFDGAEVWLKLENLQHTGSFKVRGVSNKMLNLSRQDLMKGVTAASSGNHAQAVAYMARELNTNAAIVMPENAPESKVAGAKGYGATVVQFGFTGEDRDRKCDELISQQGLTLVHSHKDPDIILGHATAALEIYDQLPDGFDELVIPCGAGSLTAGAAFYSKQRNPSVRVTAVEPEAVPRFTMSLEAGKAVTAELRPTIADGLRVGKAETINYELIRDYVDDIHLIGDDPILRAMKEILLRAKVLAEPSACVGVAAALAGRIDMSRGRRIVFVITGGNVDTDILTKALQA